jgi:hypothetical protein
MLNAGQGHGCNRRRREPNLSAHFALLHPPTKPRLALGFWRVLIDIDILAQTAGVSKFACRAGATGFWGCRHERRESKFCFAQSCVIGVRPPEWRKMECFAKTWRKERSLRNFSVLHRDGARFLRANLHHPTQLRRNQRRIPACPNARLGWKFLRNCRHNLRNHPIRHADHSTKL